MESAITNNIPEQVAQKHKTTREDMFSEWMTLFRAHVSGECDFTIAPTFSPQSRVRGDWDSLSELVKEISGAVYRKNHRTLQAMAEEQAPRSTRYQ